MFSLLPYRMLSRIRPQTQFRSCSSSHESPWFRDNKPGPYPQTEEEKIAAAKKYGLLREEYEPLPDDGSGYGDYPSLPRHELLKRDPYYNWTDPYFRRDILEPIHHEMAYVGYDKDNGEDFPFTIGFRYAVAIGFVLAFVPLVLFAEYSKKPPKAAEKQYPSEGVQHYRFDLVGSPEEKLH